jgi:hypothetical protein
MLPPFTTLKSSQNLRYHYKVTVEKSVSGYSLDTPVPEGELDKPLWGNSVLDGSERKRFVAWLGQEQAQRKLSNKTIGARLSDNATQWRLYVSGRRFPRADGCLRLAQALEIPQLLMLWRAGYLGPIIGVLPRLVREGRERLKRDGFSFQPALGGTTIRDSIRRDGYLIVQITGEYSVLVPIELHDALHIAIAAFPRRGDLPLTDADPFDDSIWFRVEKVLPIVHPRQTAPILRPIIDFPLDIAFDMLLDRRLPVDLRMAIVGELTQLWADRTAPWATQVIRPRVYKTLLAAPIEELLPILRPAVSRRDLFNLGLPQVHRGKRESTKRVK